MTEPTKWTPEFELDYVAQTSRDELLARHREHAAIFDLGNKVAALPDGAVCMEVGCGAAGGLVGLLPSRLVRIAVDPLIAQYEWIPEGLEQRAEFAHALSQPDESVDLLISIEALDHCPDLKTFWESQRELVRVLKRGGTFLFEMPEREAPRDGHPIAPESRVVRLGFERLGLQVANVESSREGIWCILSKRGL